MVTFSKNENFVPSVVQILVASLTLIIGLVITSCEAIRTMPTPHVDIPVSLPPSTISIGESRNIQLSSEKFSEYTIRTPIDGNLTLSLETRAEYTWFIIFNPLGTTFDPVDKEIITGKYNKGLYYSSKRKVKFDSNNKIVESNWNPTGKIFKGSYTFLLDAGSYTIRLCRSEQGNSAAILSTSFQDVNGNEVK